MSVTVIVTTILVPVYAAGDEDKPIDKTELAVTQCQQPRPEMCTLDYRPVCAQRQDGSEKTYSNACTACSDMAVIAHRNGACE